MFPTKVLSLWRFLSKNYSQLRTLDSVAGQGHLVLSSVTRLSLLPSLVFLVMCNSTCRTSSGTPNTTITTIGLDNIGIHLEAPYGNRSLHHVLLINDTAEHIIACEVLFESTLSDGKTYTARKVVAFTRLIRAPISDRKSLLKSQPAIAPYSKMLIGMAAEPDMVRVTNSVPPLPEGSDANETGTKFSVQSVTIRLRAVVFTDGHAEGPGPFDFLKHLQSLMQEDK